MHTDDCRYTLKRLERNIAFSKYKLQLRIFIVFTEIGFEYLCVCVCVCERERERVNFPAPPFINIIMIYNLMLQKIFSHQVASF